MLVLQTNPVGTFNWGFSNFIYYCVLNFRWLLGFFIRATMQCWLVSLFKLRTDLEKQIGLDPVGTELCSHANTFLCSNKFACGCWAREWKRSDNSNTIKLVMKSISFFPIFLVYRSRDRWVWRVTSAGKDYRYINFICFWTLANINSRVIRNLTMIWIGLLPGNISCVAHSWIFVWI